MTAQIFSERLKALRAQMDTHNIDGWIIGREDMYQGEEVPASDERLAYISGFTGSAGTAIVFTDHAALFSDGRYSLQMEKQTDAAAWSCHTMPDIDIGSWLKTQTLTGRTIGVDARLITLSAFDKLSAVMRESGLSLKAMAFNPIDMIWQDRPIAEVTPARTMANDIAGETIDSKLDRLADSLTDFGCDAVLLSRTDAVNWLANIRGHDLACTPVKLAFALYHRENGLIILADRQPMLPVLNEHMAVVPLEQLDELLEPIAGCDFMVDPASLPKAVHQVISDSGVNIVTAPCPVTKIKAQKNPVELDGFRKAHQIDGIVMAEFLCWLDHADVTQMRESALADKLLSMRATHPDFISPSFETIAGSGANGAIVHYRAVAGQDSLIQNNSLFLLDSGAHYRFGTTDITRTILIGDADAEMRRAFTAVLRGHIALARAHVPVGTTGMQLDTIARTPIWSAGLDYAHGTGHGVGHVLSVHEGPASISKRGSLSVSAGMVLSNEPGYYKTGSWGIRIENLIAVKAASTAGFIEFETLTMTPIDRRLIDKTMLSEAEIAWVDIYHQWVLSQIGADVSPPCQAWLINACAPL
ncbi:aminopeptidase P family protein [Candidatus Puniceispirillum marinum]|uniref:Peptidase M24 n=1 Tax=Puniceispirillum marinum (strain IMCC1322) TaxID=488538 RepID=D5BPR4_PUNMI|nr:aminopeptidase P family protein [Candidatus Puniceispirillum marinum]ADE40566.1 peptidase M24 [Candidatus Puniceispirillum marinum IMCC1322]